MLDLSHNHLSHVSKIKDQRSVKSPDPRSIATTKTQVKKAVVGVDEKIMTLMMNANVLVKHGEHHLALNLLRQACNLNSKHPEILKSLGQTLENLSKWTEAKIVYVELYRQFNNFLFSYKKAHCHYMLNEDEAALNTYYEALSHLQEEESNLFELYKNMGNIFVRRRDFEAAEEAYNKAYTINPDSDVLLINFGTLEVQREDFDKALFCFRKAIDVNSNNDKAWIGLALVHNHFGDRELAWGNLIKALDIDTFNRTAILLMGHWGLSEEKIKVALEYHRIFLSRHEFDEDVTLHLVHIYTQLNQLHHAESEALKLCLWSPKNEHFHRLYQQIKEKINGVSTESLQESA